MLMRTPIRWVRPKQLQPSGFIRPALPVLAHKVPDGDGWIHEVKHDGWDRRAEGWRRGSPVEPERAELGRRFRRDRRRCDGPSGHEDRPGRRGGEWSFRQACEPKALFVSGETFRSVRTDCVTQV